MPGRELLGRIVDEYDLDRVEAFRIFTSGTADEFGAFLRQEVFERNATQDDSGQGATSHAGTGQAAA